MINDISPYQRLYDGLKRIQQKRLQQEQLFDWHLQARDKQRLPDGDWRVWLIMAGRGFGKTRTGAESIRQWVKTGTARRIALIGATETEVRDVMIEGASGLLTIHPEGERPTFEPSKRRLTWPNGATATLFSAENYEQLRGPQFDGAWVDELAKFRCAQEVWDQVNFGLRLGAHPRIIVTTTPRTTPLLKTLLAGESTGDVFVTRGSTFENTANLSAPFLTHITDKYAGTLLGQQEIDGKLLEDREGALWGHALIAHSKINAPTTSTLVRIVVAVDPAVTSHGKSDESGIIVAGKDGENRGYILADHSGKYTPHGWAKKALEVYHQYKADCIVAEVNQGGDMVKTIVRHLDPHVPFKGVHASRGKVARAEPIVALYEQGRIFHSLNSGLETLEQQMTTYIPGASPGSPDRLDALVWALTELFLTSPRAAQPRIYGIGAGD